jgi:hypothetical protein
MLDAVTGELATWTGMFAAWRECTVITTDLPCPSNFRREVLAKRFESLSAHEANIAVFASGGQSCRRRITSVVDAPGGQSAARARFTSADADDLRELLGERLFQWLCSCAMYPQITWKLSVLLGSDIGLLSDAAVIDNMLSFFALPWLRYGAIPHDIRESLVSSLGEQPRKDTIDTLIECLQHTHVAGSGVPEVVRQYRLALYIWVRRQTPQAAKLLKSARNVLPPHLCTANDRMLVSAALDRVGKMPAAHVSNRDSTVPKSTMDDRGANRLGTQPGGRYTIGGVADRVVGAITRTITVAIRRLNQTRLTHAGLVAMALLWATLLALVTTGVVGVRAFNARRARREAIRRRLNLNAQWVESADDSNKRK